MVNRYRKNDRRKVINADPELALIQRVLEFANLREIKSATKVESLFRDHPFARQRHPFWLSVAAKDPNDVQGFRDLQADLRSWLQTLRAGSSTDLERLKRAVVRDFQETSSTLYRTDPRRGEDGRAYVAEEKLWGRVRFDLGETNKINFSVEPFTNGVQSAVYYGIILLFQRELWFRLKTCPAELKDGRLCSNWFVPSRELRAACSPEHKDLWNRQRVGKNVRHYYEEHGRSTRKRKRPGHRKNKIARRPRV